MMQIEFWKEVELGILSFFSVGILVSWGFDPSFSQAILVCSSVAISLSVGIAHLLPKFELSLGKYLPFAVKAVAKPISLILVALMHFPCFSMKCYTGFVAIFKAISVFLLISFELVCLVVDLARGKRENAPKEYKTFYSKLDGEHEFEMDVDNFEVAESRADSTLDNSNIASIV